MDTVMEMEIGPGLEPGSYVVRVLRSVGGGEPTETISLDLDDLVNRRPLLEASVLSSSVSARRIMSDTEAAIQDVGRRLFESAFSGEVRTAYRTSMAVASERGKNVQIALRLMAPGLAALPWETLFDAQNGTYLCRKEPLVRHVPAPYSPAALAIEPPLRVLGMIASPRGLPTLNVVNERERLEEALKPHLDSGRVELEWLDDVTWQGVHGKLLEQEWHVLHFIGHGAYDTDTDEGVLAFVGPDGRPDFVSASSLADLVDEAEPTPRLVILNSCESGTASSTDMFSGTAAALARSGVRAVAAMQFSISDGAAIAFARGFYTALAYGRGIDEAVRSGRIGILGIGRGTLEWVTPVLYLRGDDAHLFDVAKPARSGRLPEVPMVAAPESTLTPSLDDAAPVVSAQIHEGSSEPKMQSVTESEQKSQDAREPGHEPEPQPVQKAEHRSHAEPGPIHPTPAERATNGESESATKSEGKPELDPVALEAPEQPVDAEPATEPESESRPTTSSVRPGDASEPLKWWGTPTSVPESRAPMKPRAGTRPSIETEGEASGRKPHRKRMIIVIGIVVVLAVVVTIIVLALMPRSSSGGDSPMEGPAVDFGSSSVEGRDVATALSGIPERA